MRFDLTTITLFLSIVESGSIAGGAEANAIPLSAVSRRIGELETHHVKSAAVAPISEIAL